jgi:hypothetical protein
MMIFISNAFFKQFVNPSLRTEIISSEKFINPEGDSESSIAIMSKKSVKNQIFMSMFIKCIRK